MAEQEGKTIHSVAKAIRLLDLLTAAAQPASLTELYQKTGWPKSTIHGLLSTMRESGLIEQTPNGRYWLGIRLFEYGCAVSNSWDIGAIARPHMQNICTELGESVFLSVFDRAAVVTLAEEESRASLRVVSEVGARLPVHCTSQGKLFLANSSPAECRRILTHTELKAYTPHTLTTPEQFVPELTRIREQGYAVENGEYKIGLCSARSSPTSSCTPSASSAPPPTPSPAPSATTGENNIKRPSPHRRSLGVRSPKASPSRGGGSAKPRRRG